MLTENFICINDGSKTRRNSDSVIDLFLIKPHLNKFITKCQTLIQETVRSDHMGILMETVGGEEERAEVAEQYHVNKTDWMKWDELTEEKFIEWVAESKSQPREDIDCVYESFLEVFQTCMDECIPKTTVNIESRRKTPPWSNENVKAKKQSLTKLKRCSKRTKP